MEYGSLVNMVAANGAQVEPEVGMGATILMWSDRAPATVVAVNGNKLTVQYDNWERVDGNGMSDAQSYTYSPNLDAAPIEFSKRKNGKWVMVGHPLKGGVTLALGYRSRYYDYSF